MDTINLRFGPPPGMSPQVYQVFHLGLTGCICMIASILAGRYLKLSQISLSLLWILYYVIGVVFHLCSWLMGDAQAYAFLGLTVLHVFVEGLLCIKVLERKPTIVNYWASIFSIYFCIVVFLGFLLWQPLNLFFLASFVALPVDVLVWPAARTLTQRNPQDQRIKLLSNVWALNCPIVLILFAMITWGAKTENNYAGLGALVLQLQYIALGLCWIQTFGRLDASRVGVASLENDDCEELGLLPTSRHGATTVASETRPLVESKNSSAAAAAPTNEEGVGMKPALQLTLAIVGIEFALAVIVPLVLGKIDLSMMVMNVCQTFRPGNVQVLANIGPNFVIPLACNP